MNGELVLGPLGVPWVGRSRQGHHSEEEEEGEC